MKKEFSHNLVLYPLQENSESHILVFHLFCCLQFPHNSILERSSSSSFLSMSPMEKMFLGYVSSDFYLMTDSRSISSYSFLFPVSLVLQFLVYLLWFLSWQYFCFLSLVLLLMSFVTLPSLLMTDPEVFPCFLGSNLRISVVFYITHIPSCS